MTQTGAALMSIVAPIVLSWVGIILTPLVKSGVAYLEAKASAKSQLGKNLADSGFFDKLSAVAVDAVHFAEQAALAQVKAGLNISSADRKKLALDYAIKAMGAAAVPDSATGTLEELVGNSIETALHKEVSKGAI